MKIKIIKSCVVNQKPCAVGKEVIVDNAVGRFLIGIERAEEVKPTKGAKK